MKKFIIYNNIFRLSAFAVLISFSFSCASSRNKEPVQQEVSAPVPVWVTDEGRGSVFPSSDYISALGISDDVQSAENRAAAALSSYIQTEVTEDTVSRYSSGETEAGVTESKFIQEEISLLTDENLYALEYTTPWLNKKTGQYYCAAYIQKKKAWNLLCPKLDAIRADISGLQDNADRDRSGFWKTIFLGKIVSEKKQFSSFYDFAVIVNKPGAADYTEVGNCIAAAEKTIRSAKGSEKIKIQVDNDKNGIVYRALASYFESEGFTVCNKGLAKYLCSASVQVFLRKDGDVFITYPGLTITVTDARGLSAASYNATAKKTVGFEKELLEEKAYRTLEKTCSQIAWIQ